MAKKDLTAQRVRELLDYDQDIGHLYWRVQIPRSKMKIGDIAGCLAGDGYIVVGIDARYHKAHRLAWLHATGEWPSECIDHLNGNRSDNRLCNLREASKKVNAQNVHGAPKNSKSGLLGVRKYGEKWRSSIMISGEVVHLGTFDSPEEAHQRYLLAKRQHHVGFIG